MAKKTAREIVQEKMPNKRVVTPAAAADAAAPKADAVSVDLDQMRRKYFGEGGAADDFLADVPPAPSPDTGIVLVAPAQPAADAGKAQAKAVIVSDGEITGEQG